MTFYSFEITKVLNVIISNKNFVYVGFLTIVIYSTLVNTHISWSIYVGIEFVFFKQGHDSSLVDGKKT